MQPRLWEFLQIKCPRVFQHINFKEKGRGGRKTYRLKETNTASFFKWARLNCNVLDAEL